MSQAYEVPEPTLKSLFEEPACSRVEGYTQAIRNRVTVNWPSVPSPLKEPDRIPTEVEVTSARQRRATRRPRVGNLYNYLSLARNRRKIVILNLRILPIAVLAIVMLANDRVAGDEVGALLPSGVKPVWDLAKSHRDTTPTRERICINGLWRWQPAAAKSEDVPAKNWGYFKVPGCWPGITDYLQKDCQTVHAPSELERYQAGRHQRGLVPARDHDSQGMGRPPDCGNCGVSQFLRGRVRRWQEGG